MDSTFPEIFEERKSSPGAKREFRHMLKTDSSEDRAREIESLAHSGDPDDISRLIRLARKDQDLQVQVAAIKALGTSGSPEAFEPLLDILQLENISQLIEAAAVALQDLGDTRALPYIQKKFSEIEHDEISASISTIIKQMEEYSASLIYTEEKLKDEITGEIDGEFLQILLGPLQVGDNEKPFEYFHQALIRKDRESLLRLRSLMDDPNDKTRLRAIIGLSLLPSRREIREAMMAALDDVESAIRLHALRTLLKSKDPGLARQLFICLSDPDPVISMEISRYLLDHRNPEILQLAIDAMDSDDELLRVRAAALLAKTDDESIMPVIVGLLQDTSQSAELVIEIIGSLRARRARYVGRALPMLLKKGNKSILQQLALFFRKVNDPNLYAVLSKSLVSGDPRIRQGSAFLVGQASDRRSLDNLVALLEDPYDSIKIQAGWSLANLRAAEKYEDVLKAYNDAADVKLRKSFIEILSRIDRELSLPLILDACGSPSAEIRYHAAQLLGQYASYGRDEAISALKEHLTDGDLRVRFLSINSLITLGIEDFGIPMESLLDDLKSYLFDTRQAANFRIQAIQNLTSLLRDKSVDIFVDILRHDADEQVLSAAAEAMATLHDPAALASLIDLLSGDNHFVRNKVAQALCTTQDPSAVPHLLEYIQRFQKSEDTGFNVTTYLITEYVNRTLRKPFDHRIEDMLLSLLNKNSLTVRKMAAFHLAYGGSEAICEPFLKLLKSPFHTLFYLAALGLGRFGMEKAVPRLVEILMDRELVSVQDAKSRSRVKEDLGKYYGLLSRFDELKGERYEPSVAKKVLVTYFLGKMKQHETIEPLLAQSRHEKPVISVAALKALENFDEPSIIPHLLDLRENCSDFFVQNALNTVLRRQKERTRNCLFELLLHRSPEKRVSAARTFAELRGLAAHKELIPYLKDDNWLVRYWTVTAIAKSGVRRAESMTRLMEKKRDPSPLVRSGLLYAMMVTDREKFTPILLESLKDPHFFVRAEASKISGGLKLMEAEKILIDNLSDFSATVRAASVRALGEIGSSVALKQIKKTAEQRTNQEHVWAIYAMLLLNEAKSEKDLARILEECAEGTADEILVLRAGKPRIIKYYPGVYKKLGDLGFKPAPLLYREEFEEFKEGNDEFVLRFAKSMDWLYVEKISEKKENYYQTLEALGALGTGEAAGILGNILKSKNEKSIKSAVLRALTSMQVKDAKIAMIPGLADPSPEIYMKVVQALRHHYDEYLVHVDAFLDELAAGEKERIRIHKLLQ